MYNLRELILVSVINYCLHSISVHINQYKTRKGFQKKTTFAFENSTEFILDLYNDQTCLVSYFGLEFVESSYSQLPGNLKYLHAKQIPLTLSFYSKTMPDM